MFCTKHLNPVFLDIEQSVYPYLQDSLKQTDNKGDADGRKKEKT